MVRRLRGIVYRDRFGGWVLQIQGIAVHLGSVGGRIVNSLDVSKSIAYDLVGALANERFPVRGATGMNDFRPVASRENNVVTSLDGVHRRRPGSCNKFVSPLPRYFRKPVKRSWLQLEIVIGKNAVGLP